MPQPTIGIGLAGLGQHGIRYARHLLANDVPGAALRAVWRRDRARGREWALEAGVAWCDSLDELAGHDAVDLLVAVLPPSAHPAAIEIATRAGKAVLVEKPLAADRASADAACETARRFGARAGVAHTLRFNPVVVALRQELAGLGRLQLLALDQRFEPTERPWLDDPAEGGLLLNTGCHGTDLLHLLTGARVVSASARARALVTKRCEDLFAAVLELEPGGIVATLDNSRATGGRSGRVELVGERGILRADHVHGTLERIEGRERRSLPLPPPAPTVPLLLGACVEALREDEPLPVSLEEGRDAVAAVDIIRDALRDASRGASDR